MPLSRFAVFGCVAWAGGWPLVGVLGCGPPSPLFLVSLHMLTHVMLQIGLVSLCTCLLSLMFIQFAVHLLASFYLPFACLHSPEGFFIHGDFLEEWSIVTEKSIL